MRFFPHAPRPFQAEATAMVAATAREGGHLVLEAPTGSGKTLVLLAGALEAAQAAGKKILYVTRTNSQQEQAVRELIAIRKHTGAPLRAFPLQGRARLCLKLEDAHDPDLDEASPEELSHFCGHAKALSEADRDDPKGCRHYAGLLSLNDDDLRRVTGAEPRTAEAYKVVARAHGFCSYEATKRLLPGADVVIAPYVFAFDPGLRSRLFLWWGVPQEDVILVVDEAHNLPQFLRELESPRLSRERLARALTEADELRNPLVRFGLSARALLEALDEAVQSIVQEYCKEEDGFVPPFELESLLLGRFRLTTNGLLEASDQLAQLGEVVKDRRRVLGRVPRSHLSRVAAFLRHWVASDEEGYVKLAVREPRAYLEAFLVDASRAAEGLRSFHATIHASGTLAPLAEYRDTLGLGPATRLEKFPSPFPPENLTVLVTRGLTTKYERLRSDPALVDRLQGATRAILGRARVKTAVFFPSHQLLEEFREVGAFPEGPRQVLVEQRATSQEALMRLVRAHRDGPEGSILVGVLGGRLSEGMDFPGRELEAAVVVGVPYPRPTAHQRALFQYYEARHGQGWEYAVKAPAVRRLRQALGRLIRGPTDRGLAVVLDERAAPLLGEAGIRHAVAGVGEVEAAFAAWPAAAAAAPPRLRYA